MRAPLPWDRLGVHPTVVSYIAAAVDTSTGVEDLFVPTFAWCADTIEMSRDGGRIYHEHNDRAGFRLAHKRQNTVVGIVKIDPLKAEITVVIFPKCRFGLIEIIEMLDQPSDAIVRRILQQMPINALVVIPFFPLADFATHKQQFFAPVRIHPSIEHAQVA